MLNYYEKDMVLVWRHIDKSVLRLLPNNIPIIQQLHSDPFGRKSSKKLVFVWKYLLSFLLFIKGHLIPF